MKANISLWLDTSPAANYPRLDEHITVDVAIIGGGMAGLSTAYLLKQAGLTVAVIDSGVIAGATSGKTTGKVTSQHGLIYDKLIRNSGLGAATIYGQANEAGLRQIDEIIQREKIDCDWQRDDSYVFTTDPDKLATMKAETGAARRCGLPATFETASPLPFQVTGAVRFTGQAKFHARKYLLGLAAAISGDGSRVYENSRALGIRDGAPGRVKTSGGEITAKYIVVATNVPTLPLLARGAYCILEYPQTSYIVAAQLDHELTGMYISPDKDHYSILPVTTAGQHYLLIGGEGHLPGTRVRPWPRYDRLAEYASQKFGAGPIDYRWHARDYLAYDDIPLVGRAYPWSKNLFVATAFMKWGLTNTTVAATILTDLIRGQPSPWAETFNSLRHGPIRSIPKVLKEKISNSL